MATATQESAEEIKRRIGELNLEHRDLDRAIEALELNPLHDELQLKRLKKRKLMLKDQIQRIIDSSTGSGAWYYSQGRWARAITPTGRFRVYWRYNGWQPGPLGSMYRPNYFHGGYALHGMTSVPAYPASHGCVRMTVPTMDRMWSSLWVGMPVAVYRS